MIWPGRHDSLGSLLHDALIQYKTETACILCNRKRVEAELSYRELAARAGGIAEHLEIEPGDRVAILLSNQPDWLASAIAVFTLGGVLVPLDIKLSTDEQRFLLEHSGAKLLITERRFKIDGLLVDELEASGRLPERVPRTRSDLACIVYSSGTGGTPKGCMLSHGAYLAQLESLLALFPLGMGDRYLSILPTNHAIDFMCGFVGALSCGATVVHQRTLRPEFLVHTLRTTGITHMAVVPLILTALQRAVQDKLDALDGWKKTAFSALSALNGALTRRGPDTALSRRLLPAVHEAFGGRLERVFCGGAPCDREVAEFFYSLGIPVVIGYGLTEAGTVVTVNDLRPFRADSVGRAVPGTEIRIADPDEHGVGEVLVRGPTLMDGYLNAESPIEEGWLHTGDLGWLDASFHLHLVGRSKNMIVTPGGKNVYPEDIEGQLGEVGCEELAVFAANWIWSRQQLEDDTLVAVIREGDLEALSRLNRRLPDYKRIRSVLCWEEPFPRTASLKVKRGLLAEQIRSSTPRTELRPLC